MYSKLFNRNTEFKNLTKLKDDLKDAIYNSCIHYDKLISANEIYDLEHSPIIRNSDSVKEYFYSRVISGINTYLRSRGANSIFKYENNEVIINNNPSSNATRNRMLDLKQESLKSTLDKIAHRIIDTYKDVYCMRRAEKVLNYLSGGLATIGSLPLGLGVVIFTTPQFSLTEHATPEERKEILEEQNHTAGVAALISLPFYTTALGLFGATQWWFGSKRSRVEKAFEDLVDESVREIRELEREISSNYQGMNILTLVN
jgi:hypothetical protein